MGGYPTNQRPSAQRSGTCTLHKAAKEESGLTLVECFSALGTYCIFKNSSSTDRQAALLAETQR